MNNKNHANLVAVKIIELKKVADVRTIRKEICIHKSLSHERIVKFFGYREEVEEYYVFMEYVPNGELYNLIEPGGAMLEKDCIKLFGQLLDGVEYMHGKGIVHRDLKLENLLIDENENLKITDFGLSTMFRYQGKERLLERVCGSLPYASPEIMARQKHKAEPVDIWSCGIILYIMFQGEMPWDVANLTSPEYTRWTNNSYPSLRWKKLDKYKICILL
uniref:non-specific serine/threonine protein kinase n=1 Tax=Myxobolus squamalis TaxID=59785 RepID=A0A6B2FYL4_MYXSQ